MISITYYKHNHPWVHIVYVMFSSVSISIWTWCTQTLSVFFLTPTPNITGVYIYNKYIHYIHLNIYTLYIYIPIHRIHPIFLATNKKMVWEIFGESTGFSVNRLGRLDHHHLTMVLDLRWSKQRWIFFFACVDFGEGSCRVKQTTFCG